MDDKLVENAIKTMDRLHQLFLLWLGLCFFYAVIPNTAMPSFLDVALPFTSVQVGKDSLRSFCLLAIFSAGFIGSALLAHLVYVCNALTDRSKRQAILTYPSIATVGSENFRWQWFFFGLSPIQFACGAQFSTQMWGSDWVYLGFAYATPIWWFAHNLSRWQTRLEINKLESN